MPRTRLLSCLALASVVACTGRPLPGGDELGDDGSTGAGHESSSTTDGETETGETQTGESAETGETGETGEPAETGGTETGETDSGDETETDEGTTGDDCGYEIAGDLTIDADTPLDDLACLREVGGTLRIREVDWTDLSPLSGLERVGHLWLEQNELMEDLSGTSLVEIGWLELSLLPSLDSTAGLEQLEALSWLEWRLGSHATIELPVGLPTVGIRFHGGADLEPLAVLQVEPSGPAFYVDIDSGIVDISALELCCAVPELDLTIPHDSALVDLTGLESFTTMHGLHLNEGQLTDFTGLEQLESIGELEVSGGKCQVHDDWGGPSVQITSLAGLDSLSSIGALRLRFMFELQTLAGLPPGATAGDVELRNLAPVSQAEVEAFAAALGAPDPLICGLEGEPLCLFGDEIHGICPQ